MTMPGAVGQVTETAAQTATQAGEAATQATGGFMGQWGGLIMMLLIFAVFYVVLILPQKKQEKKQRAMIDALKPGDEVVTIGGIYGNVVSVKEDAVVIETSADKTKIKLAKSSISRCVNVEETKK
jgi:preprotein translocase subunit YajC